jgi:hypothetical protein
VIDSELRHPRFTAHGFSWWRPDCRFASRCRRLELYGHDVSRRLIVVVGRRHFHTRQVDGMSTAENRNGGFGNAKGTRYDS